MHPQLVHVLKTVETIRNIPLTLQSEKMGIQITTMVVQLHVMLNQDGYARAGLLLVLILVQIYEEMESQSKLLKITEMMAIK